MNIAFAYEQVLPERGGCATYISDLSRRLVADRHEVHLYASRWDATALPEQMHFHALPSSRGPRFARPWLFGRACLHAMEQGGHQVTIGFDKTWGQDILYPQGGLHAASAAHNLLKFKPGLRRSFASWVKHCDLAHWSFGRLEKKQYVGKRRPLIVVNSEMVKEHFRAYLALPSDELRVIRSAIDPDRFAEQDRLRRRIESRTEWDVGPSEVVGLFVAMNYRLKGMEPLLHAVACLPIASEFRLLIVGDSRFSAYASLARRLGIEQKVVFLGPRRDIKNCFFASDFLVHPTFYDPCSLVVLEAFACGLPVITSIHNGASELMHPPKEGFVIEDPHDHRHLANCMERILDPATRQACAQAARRASREWTFEHHYRQLLVVMREAMARKKAA